MEMVFFTRRWGHNNYWQITWTQEGWQLEAGARRGPCDPTGAPVLFDALDNDGVQYPRSLGAAMQRLWEAEAKHGQEFSKSGLDEICAWISATERAVPRREEFERLL